MADRYQLTRAAELEALAEFRDFIDAACADHPNIDEAFRYDLKLAVDEACNNIITHGYAGMNPGSIILALEIDPRRVVMTLTDFGHAFEPSEAPMPDVAAGLEDRPTGGFGLYFIYQTMDEVSYETTDDSNRLTLVKRLPSNETAQSKGEGSVEITARQVGETTVVSIVGSVDALTAVEVADFLSAQIGGGHKHIVGDLSRVKFISSAGLRVVLTALKESRQQSGDLRLAAAQAGVEKTLKMSGFSSIMKLFPSVDEAVDSFDS